MGGRGGAGYIKAGPDTPGEPMVTLYHRTTKFQAQGIVENGFKTNRSGWVYFSTDPDDAQYRGYGHEVVAVRVPKRLVRQDRQDKGNAVKVAARHLKKRKLEHRERR